MSASRSTTGRGAGAAEAIILAMAGVAPWLFGSEDAWAEWGLLLGASTVALLGAACPGRRPPLIPRLTCGPSLGLLGLVLLALGQATPLSPAVANRLAPAWAARRAALVPPDRTPPAPTQLAPIPPTRWPTLSQDPDRSRQMATRLVGGWLLLQGVLALPTGGAGLGRLGLVFRANAVLLVLVALAQAWTWNGRLLWVRPIVLGDARSVGGPFNHHTHLAESLNLGLGMALGLALKGGIQAGVAWQQRVWAGAAAGGIALGIATSYSRSGTLAMVGAALVVGTWAGRTGGRFRWIGPAVVGSLGAATILLTVATLAPPVSPAETTSILARLRSIGDPNDAGYAVRAAIGRAALHAWWGNPIWGTGLGSFAVAVAPNLDGRHGATFARAENEYLDLLTEGGLIGIGCLILAGTGLVRLVRAALSRPADQATRPLILGATFGLLALALNSLGDFGPHVAGVGVPALILGGTLCRLGLPAGQRDPTAPRRRWQAVAARTITQTLIIGAIAGAAIVDKLADVRVESRLARAGLPGPDDLAPPWTGLATDRGGLERQRADLAWATQLRPNWADGWLRLGMADLALALLEHGGRPAEIGAGPDPARIVAATRAEDPTIAGPGEGRGDQGKSDLSRAAQSFRSARPICPTSPFAHAELACLETRSGATEPAEAAVGLERALRLSGARAVVLDRVARGAAALGVRPLAAQAWRRLLIVAPDGWATVADQAEDLLAPDQILNEVIPDGRTALRFADRLGSADSVRPLRRRLLAEAARRLPDDAGLEPAERSYLQAHAAAALDRRAPARHQMAAALDLEPENLAWRRELVTWLLLWGELEDAHEQARIGLAYAPRNPAARTTLEATAEALSRGRTPP